jgi:N-acetyl-beta-hexosaminidase
MKLTESEIAKFIEEEMKSDPALKNAIDKLSNKIDNLDVSIDYLASALTGEDVLDIGLSQKALGRFRTAPGADLGQADMSEDVSRLNEADASGAAYAAMTVLRSITRQQNNRNSIAILMLDIFRALGGEQARQTLLDSIDKAGPTFLKKES